MLFDIESFDYSYYDEGSEGLKVALVHHLDMPIMRQTGFHIAPGTENQIAVTPTLIQTSKNAMLRFTPAERDCYSEDEISLKYLPRDHGYRYEMSNCLFESAFENILKQCKCFPGKTIQWYLYFSREIFWLELVLKKSSGLEGFNDGNKNLDKKWLAKTTKITWNETIQVVSALVIALGSHLEFKFK